MPKGFKSVQAPVILFGKKIKSKIKIFWIYFQTALPPEQRHAPTRVEYQAQHLKQNWIEPK